MRTSRFLKLLSLLLVLGLVLAACGGGQQAEPTEAPADQPEQQAEPTEPPADDGEAADGEEDGEAAADGATTVTIATGSVGQELELTQAAAQRYMEANPNVTVEVLDTPDLANDRLGVYLQFFEAQSPEVDIYQIDVIWPGDLATHLVDLYEYGADQYVDQHFEAIVQNNTVDGALVGMPWFTDAGLLYYRTDLLEKYGYDAAPETWDELEEMAATIQQGERDEGNPDFWGFVWQGNAYEGLTCDALEWVASHGGGEIINRDEVITINNENAVAAIDRAASWVGEISPPGVTGFGEEDARGIWQAGNAAFMRNWPYAYSLGQADDSPIQDMFDVAPLPHTEGQNSAATLGGWQLAVSQYSNNPEVAADVVFFLTSEEEQKVRAVEGSLNPTIRSLYEDPEVLEAAPFYDSLFEVFTNAVARPSTITAPNYQETSRIFYTGVHDVLTGNTDAETAVAEMELDLQDLHGFETGNP